MSLYYRQLAVSSPCKDARLLDIRAIPEFSHTFRLCDDCGVSRARRGLSRSLTRASVSFSHGELYPVTVVLDCPASPQRRCAGVGMATGVRQPVF